MFFRDLRMKPDAALDVAPADVHLPVRLGHRDADKLFSEPLGQQMAALGLGRVLSCASRARATGEVIGVDLRLGLTDPSKAGLLAIAEILERLSAPLGSSIRLVSGTGTPLVFGRAEGIEVSVGSDTAPDGDARRELAQVCRGAIERLGVNRGWIESGGRTRLYFYGEDAKAMKAELARTLVVHPRFGGARFDRLA
jgi:hypothetical protein